MITFENNFEKHVHGKNKYQLERRHKTNNYYWYIFDGDKFLKTGKKILYHLGDFTDLMFFYNGRIRPKT